jgi:hypothetical protein
MDLLFEHVLIVLNEEQHVFQLGLLITINSLITKDFYLVYSLYRNKSSYKVQLINPNKTPNTDNQPAPVEQNNTDESTKPTDGLFSYF